jgi:hypothetical protein
VARGDREPTADPGVIEVERAGVGIDQGAVGEEEGVGAVAGGVDEGRPAGGDWELSRSLTSANWLTLKRSV